MSGQRHEIHALIQVKPEEARKRILAALKSAGMHKGEAAAALGCSHGTLLRWIGALSIGAAINALTARALKEGWHHNKSRQGGRPAGSKDKAPRVRRRAADAHP